MHILYRDDALLAVDKPAGMLSVPGRGEGKRDCVAARVQAMFADALVVHRLDMATSGLLLMARGAAAQRRLGMAFAQREVDKRYVAVVAGRPPASGEIDLPLSADWPNRPMQKVDREHGKPSLTRYRVLDYDAASDTARVELEPLTGRSHQLRVHLCALGHPIVGDALYAPPAIRSGATRLLLHACGLRMPHPTTGEPLALASAAPF
ncbi:pseudouridine synthase [Piscinibacter sp.]|jgi:tRNA pseudouridine32 synthase/23S rRNA pseudouridine746 synthase|uniref:pseudouridine synthase n=1 Tax=Piscinibacter sp. TaxID=1903157 RepID=UPI002F3FFEE3